MAEHNILGIYNYCDRWCERCKFTSRCAVYENELDEMPPSDESDHNQFFNRVAQNLSKAHELLQQAAEHYGIDLKAIAAEANDIDLKQKIIRQESREHPVAELSFQYSQLSMDWLRRQPGMLEKLEELKEELTIGVESVVASKEMMHMIKESLATIKWYESFIHVKLMRALAGKSHSADDHFIEIEHSNYGNDSDGSAKIALIAIDNSLHAWENLFELLPQHEDEFLNILGLLDKLKKQVTATFPKAMAFRRPGFDD